MISKGFNTVKLKKKNSLFLFNFEDKQTIDAFKNKNHPNVSQNRYVRETKLFISFSRYIAHTLT